VDFGIENELVLLLLLLSLTAHHQAAHTAIMQCSSGGLGAVPAAEQFQAQQSVRQC
jgi:hypothetical protein